MLARRRYTLPLPNRSPITTCDVGARFSDPGPQYSSFVGGVVYFDLSELLTERGLEHPWDYEEWAQLAVLASRDQEARRSVITLQNLI